jgi:hypothetical protein
MIDIYEQKAKKYKYKYLKLKNTYIAKGGNGFNEEQADKTYIEKQVTKTNIKQIIDTINYDFEFIGEGSFGCIISPPLQFNNTIYIKNLININDDELNEIFTSKEYVGKLLSCDNEVFNKEYEDFLKLKKIDPEAKHRSVLIFAAYMNKEELTTKLEELKNKEDKQILDDKEDKQILDDKDSVPVITPVHKLYYCLKKIKLLNNIFNNVSSASENYGYIISTRVGKSFKDHKLNDFNNGEIITILKNLKESIGDIIQKLYDNESIHGDIKFDNMTLDENLKVYFIDFGFMQKYYELDNLKTSSHQYPEILNIFLKIKNKFKNYKEDDEEDEEDEDDFEKKLKKLLKKQTLNKEELINLLKKYQQEKINSIQSDLLNFTNLNFIDYNRYFESLEDNIEYSLDDYTKCIEQIAKNIDIYALSLYIYKLFYNYFDEIKPFNYFDEIQPFNYFKTSNNIKDYIINLYNAFINNTNNILNVLLINALYNNIDGPEELIIYLEAIINSIEYIDNKSLYKEGYITNKIKDRRNNLELKIPFYIYYDNHYKDSNYIYNYYK